MNDFYWAGKSKQPTCKTLLVGTKNEENLNNFKKILRFFDPTVYGKVTFHNYLLNISWVSDSVPKVYT